jgi:hypothetical protein
LDGNAKAMHADEAGEKTAKKPMRKKRRGSEHMEKDDLAFGKS